MNIIEHIESKFIGRTPNNQFIYESRVGELRLIYTLRHKIPEPEVAIWLKESIPLLLDEINKQFKKIEGNELDRFKFYLEHPQDSRSKKIDAFFSSLYKKQNTEVTSPELAQEQLVDLLTNMSLRDGSTRLIFREFLAENNIKPVLSEINFFIVDLTVTKVRGLGITPYWGNNLLKNIEFEGLEFKNCCFKHVNLQGCTFKNCSFEKCDFSKTVLDMSEFDNVNFEECNFFEAKLDYSKCMRCKFSNCSLRYTSFYSAVLQATSIFSERLFYPLRNERVAASDSLSPYSYYTSLEGANFLNAHIENSTIKNCNITNLPECSLHSGFDFIDCASLEKNKPSVLILWNNENPGYSSSKLNFALKSTVIPIKYNYNFNQIDHTKLRAEVEGILAEITHSTESSLKTLPLPQAIIQVIKRKEAQLIPNLKTIMEKSVQIINQIDALVLPGGNDIEPEFYGKEKQDQLYTCDPSYCRTILEFALINEAKTRGMPILGICRGAQVYNVYEGGNLGHVLDQIGKIQHIKTEADSGLIKGIVGENLHAISFHKFAVDIPGAGLTLVSAMEGVPKAFENDFGAPLVLVQFHPEFAGLAGKKRNPKLSGTNKNFWFLIGEAANIYRQKKYISREVAKRLTEDQTNEAALAPNRPFLDKGPKIGSLRSNDAHQLLQTDESVPSSEYEWHLRLGLLKRAYGSAKDMQIKQMIRSIANNYLAKTAPLAARTKTILSGDDFDLFFHTTPFPSHLYHRQTGFKRQDENPEINENLGYGRRSPLLLIDNTAAAELFEIKFMVFNASTSQNECVWRMTQSVENYLRGRAKNNFHSNLPVEFLFDFSHLLGEVIHTNGNFQNEVKFDNRFSEVREIMEQIILEVTQNLLEEYPYLDEEQLLEFIKKNITAICMVDLKEYAGIKILPLFANLTSKSDVAKKHPTFHQFVVQAGLFLGAVTYRRHILDGFALRNDVDYLPTGKVGIYFPQPGSFVASALFNRLETIFTEKAASQPHIGVLGGATMCLVRGLLQEISPDKWSAMTSHPELNEVLQTTLVRLQHHLAHAELGIENFNEFSKNIELAHYELAVLLELFKPFEEKDFAEIYKGQIVGIPSRIKDRLNAGLGKTAVNTFAGIHKAIMETTPNKICCYSPSLYFEEISSFGKSHPLAAVLNTKKIKKVDLYACQFNPNIDINTHTFSYQAQDIQGDVEKLLELKHTEHMTVAVDCTIDYLNSPQAGLLLKRFEQEILDGTLNFVFFRSGQKFDMLGIDNYFGSPFYVINNGDPHWKTFDRLFESKAHKTDHLSLQWFCLANRYAADYMDEYRRQIFTNARDLLKSVPEALKAKAPVRTHKGQAGQKIRVSNVDDDGMLVSFLDIKILGENASARARTVEEEFFNACAEEGVAIQSKPSFGFFTPNINRITSHGKLINIRVNPGLDPKGNQAIGRFLERLAAREDLQA